MKKLLKKFLNKYMKNTVKEIRGNQLVCPHGVLGKNGKNGQDLCYQCLNLDHIVSR